MSLSDRITPARWLMEWSLAEGRAARKSLDRYARHDAGCPTGEGRSGSCTCGLDAAQNRTRDAVRTAENLLAELENRDTPPREGGDAEPENLPPQK